MWAFKLQSFCKCNIRDDWPQIAITNIIIMKKSEMLRELPKCDTDITWANAVGKTPPVNWLDAEFLQMFSLLKEKKNLWSTIKQSAGKWGTLVTKYIYSLILCRL